MMLPRCAGRIVFHCGIIIACNFFVIACIPHENSGIKLGQLPPEVSPGAAPLHHDEPDAELKADLQWLAATFAKNPRKRLRQKRSFHLANSLEVLLISDPFASKSAVAMDVGIGSLQDQGTLGLAHFTEHLLFLGSQKYPDVGDFRKFITDHQGHNNAYTFLENTNYHFELNHEGLVGALDRFAQFFIAPKFDPDYIKRERHAIHAEHQKNLTSDGQRNFHLLKYFSSPHHPFAQFASGSLATLHDVDRETVVDFYRHHYSANLMKLAVISSYPLDTLEAWVDEAFSPVPNHNLARPQYDPKIFAAAQLPRLIAVKPIKDTKNLQLNFALPNLQKFWQSKPHQILTHLLCHEGPGSLLFHLRAEGLATGISARFTSASFAAILHVTIELSDTGFNAYERVIEYFSSYVAMLKHLGLPKTLFEELRKMARFNFAFRDENEGVSLAANYAATMRFVPAEQIEETSYLFHRYDPDEFKQIVTTLTPDNMQVFLLAPEVETNAIELYYGTSYRELSVSDEVLSRWQNPRQHEGFALPAANPLIPRLHDFIPVTEKTTELHLLDEDWGDFWLKVDDQFFVPTGKINLTLVLDKEQLSSPAFRARANLYNLLLAEHLRELVQQANIAGIKVEHFVSNTGLQIIMSGYTEKIPTLLARLCEAFATMQFTEQTFATIKRRSLRQHRNLFKRTALQLATSELLALLSKNTMEPSSYFNPDLHLDELSPLTSSDLRCFAMQVFSRIGIAGSAYGHFDPAMLGTALTSFARQTGHEYLDRQAWQTMPQIQLPADHPLVRVVETPSPDDYGVITHLQLGKRTPQNLAMMHLGEAIFRASFFEELRTKQQLGYMVSLQSHSFEQSVGLKFTVQSPHTNPAKINQSILTWQQHAIALLAELSEEQFSCYREAIVQNLRRPATSINEAHSHLHFYFFKQGGQSDENGQILTVLNRLSKAEVLAFYQSAFAPLAGKNLSIYVEKILSSNEPLPTGAALLADPQQFKLKAPIF